MRIRQLTTYVVRLPLKRPFTHASVTRRESDNVLVCCELADGTRGWGEGVPRKYVTGETPEGCLGQLGATPVAEQLAVDCNSWPDVIALCERFHPAEVAENPRGCHGNALRCAVELSILDAFGRLFGEPSGAVAAHYDSALPILAPRAACAYSAVVGSGHRMIRPALVRRIYGFHHCKVKVGKPGDDDQDRLRTIRRWIGPRVVLRVDANEAWRPDELRAKVEPLVSYGVRCVEQPVPHAEVSALAELRPQLSVPIMLDESLTSLQDAQAAIDGRTCDLFNIRLSKCGGFLASLRLAAVARAAGLGFQLGCHPGESGVLSAAGRQWACTVADVLYLEGSYDRHILNRLLTNEDFTFGYGGRAPALTDPGWGATINPPALAEMTVAHQDSPIM